MAVLYSPSAQVWHVEGEVAAVAVEYLPASHSRQVLEFARVWYSPVPHGVHTNASPPALRAEENPAEHTQSTFLPDPASDSVLSGQDKQAPTLS